MALFLVYMRSIKSLWVRSKLRLFHIHIPKTAGTYLNRAFTGSERFINGGHCMPFAGIRVLGSTSIGRKDWPDYRESGYQDSDTIVTVLRNPFDWLVSYWAHKGRSWAGLRKHNGWQGATDFLESSSFDCFVRHFCLNKRWHLPLLQHDPLCQIKMANGELVADVILFTEFIDEGISWLSQTYDLEIQNVRKSEANKNSDRLSYKSYYTEELVQLVENKFSSWIKIGGYEFEREQPMSQRTYNFGLIKEIDGY